MAKKKKGKKHHFRNAAPRAPRAAKHEEETPLKRLAFTAGGAAGTALAGSFLAHEGWAPKTMIRSGRSSSAATPGCAKSARASTESHVRTRREGRMGS